MYQVSFVVDRLSQCPRFRSDDDGQFGKKSIWVQEPSQTDLVHGPGFCIVGFVESRADLDYLFTALKKKGVHSGIVSKAVDPWPQ